MYLVLSCKAPYSSEWKTLNRRSWPSEERERLTIQNELERLQAGWQKTVLPDYTFRITVEDEKGSQVRN